MSALEFVNPWASSHVASSNACLRAQSARIWTDVRQEVMNLEENCGGIAHSLMRLTLWGVRQLIHGLLNNA